jgi:hypothetical protein
MVVMQAWVKSAFCLFMLLDEEDFEREIIALHNSMSQTAL